MAIAAGRSCYWEVGVSTQTSMPNLEIARVAAQVGASVNLDQPLLARGLLWF